MAIFDPEIRGKNGALLKELRERYHHALNYWDPIRSEGATDMRYISGDPWDDEAKQERKDAGRPFLSLDELNQYLNQAENNIRQNPRGIKVEPAGEGATDSTAEFYQGKIRDIEYASSAQRNAYAPAFISALQRSYGYFMLRRRYIGKTFDQEIYIEGITDPDTVLFDPDVAKADWSDAGFFFLAKPMRKEEFKRKYPKAKTQDFSRIDFGITTKDWLRRDHIVVAEYWRVVAETKNLLLVKTPEGPKAYLEDEVPKGDFEILKEREIEVRHIEQYITNGVEILEEKKDEPGEYLPCIPVIGKELWIDTGAGSERKILSLVRLARDPQMLFNYYCTQEAEEAEMCPKTPWVGAKGQFESAKATWATLSKQPVAYVEYDPVVDSTGPTPTVLPAPTRPQFTPNFQQYEMAKDSARRSIQAAMGLSQLPTAAQRNNEKSGIALERIENQEQIGSFHFTDNFDRALELAGRIIESWIPIVYDTEREEAIRGEDGKHQMVRINTDQPVTTKDGNQYHYPVGGTHRVSISTGPSTGKQREDAAAFLDTLISNLPNLPVPPPQAAQILAMAVRARNMGPQGDKIADIIAGDPNAQANQASQAINQLQQQKLVMDELQKELQQLRLEKQGKVIDNQFKLQIKQLEVGADNFQQKLANDIKVLTALITAKRGQEDQEYEMYKTFWQENHKAAHEVALSAQEHNQNLAAADQAAGHAQALAAAQPQPDNSPSGAQPE